MVDSGVYQITVPNGRIYIGSSVHIARRWQSHKARLKAGRHHNRALQAIAAKHGIESLSFRRILFCDKSNLICYEQLAMDALSPELNGTRLAGNTLGFRHREETKAAFQFRPKGRGNYGNRHSESTKAAISAKKAGKPSNRKGAKLSQDTKEKIRTALAGRINSADQIARQKESFARTMAKRKANVRLVKP